MVRLGIVTGMVYSWDYHFKNNENQNISKQLKLFTFKVGSLVVGCRQNICGLLGVPTLVAEVC